MSSLDRALFLLLTTDPGVAALVASRVFPVMAPTQAGFPLVIYQRAGYLPTHAMDGAQPLARSTYQLDTYASSARDAAQVGEAIRTALDGYHGTVEEVFVQRVLLMNQGLTLEDDESGGQDVYYRVTQELDIWHDQSARIFA